MKIKVGRLPLHLAIGKKMSFNVIKLFLEAEIKFAISSNVELENEDIVNGLLDQRIILKEHGINHLITGKPIDGCRHFLAKSRSSKKQVM